jgi:hypothetical protein
VLLQRQDAATGGLSWGTIQTGVVGAGGSFTFDHVFVVPGDANIRALVRGGNTHLPSASPALTYAISQAQNPQLTANASADPIASGSAVTISGTLAGGANQTLTLYQHQAYQPWSVVTQVTTASDGSYSLPAQSPAHSTYYQVRGTAINSRLVFVAVHDVLTASASTTSIPQGGTVTFSGNVQPDHSGHAIWLQEENKAGTGFHTVQVATVLSGSTYSIVHQMFAVGTRTLRVQIPGGPESGGASSQTFSVTVTPVAPAQLPQQQPAAQSQGQ